MHSALRTHLEDALRDRRHHWTDPFRRASHSTLETVPTGIESIDALTGGFPRGQITEVLGNAGSGQTSLWLSALARFTTNGECCAFVDPAGGFDPASALQAGVQLDRFLWVRPGGRAGAAFKAADWILQGGGFGLVGLDLGALPVEEVRGVPRSVWFRWQRALENTPAVLVVMGRTPAATTCAGLCLRLEIAATEWSSRLFHGVRLNAVVLRSKRNPDAGRNAAAHRLHLKPVPCLRAVRPEAHAAVAQPEVRNFRSCPS